MRLKPVEQPRGWKMKLAYALCKRKFGHVITPFKVVQARVPASIPLYQQFTRFATRETILEPALLLLIQSWTANYNQCDFCIDILHAFAAHDKTLLEKLWRVTHYAADPVFSDAERAALAYVEEVTRDRDARAETFEALRKHYSERAIVEITLVNAIENFYNLVNRPLGIGSDGMCPLHPSMAPGKQPAAAKA